MSRSFDTPVETKPENRRYDNRNHQKQEKQYKDEDISKLKKEISEAGVRKMKNIRIGSRESRLAVVQSEMVMDYIKEKLSPYALA